MKIVVLLGLFFAFIFASVDINTADEKALTKLKGVGMSKAKMIVAYREANCFKSVKELANVKGIGQKTVEKNLENLTASECKEN